MEYKKVQGTKLALRMFSNHVYEFTVIQCPMFVLKRSADSTELASLCFIFLLTVAGNVLYKEAVGCDY